VGHHIAVRVGGGGGQLSAALVEQEDGARSIASMLSLSDSEAEKRPPSLFSS